ncbi:MAG TPA: ATP-dependent DNA helicase [Steroidobacteraceae bacterium]
MTNLRELFGAGGALQRSLTGFVSRPGQRRLAERIAEALALREVLLVEAGTGTGKTFAYLVPALLSGLRVLISTGTRPLQDQLYGRDLPLLGAALGRPVKVALLKGRANYLCRARLVSAQQDWVRGRGGALRARIHAWAEATRSGDLAEVAELGESHPLRAELTSTRESCTGARCAEFSRCHVFAARRAALEAQIVVVNHHLLLADLALKEEGFGDLLPSADALILDEAHQLPELAAEVFGIDASSRQIELLLQVVRRNLGAVPSAGAASEAALGELQSSLQEAMLGLGRAERRVAWQDLEQLNQRRCAALAPALAGLAVSLPGSTAELEACSARARALAHAIATVTDPTGELGARTLSVHARGFALSLLPYDISARFSALVRQRPAAWIFCSATLALAGDFSHFAGRLGLGDAATLCVDSPFDYERQSLLYLPLGLPDPADPGYTDAVVDFALPLLQAAGGGAFLLFTSHRALGLAARRLREATSLEMLVQGEAPRERLLERFRASGRAVLLGTASFWEGVDVQGAALRLVLIDKLPFAALDEPQLRARVEYIKSQGGNPFRDYQLPEAALALKQGVGRLIRSESDRGVVVICDPRLTQRGYGRTLIAALPPMRPTRELPEVLALLCDCQGELDTPAAVERLA